MISNVSTGSTTATIISNNMKKPSKIKAGFEETFERPAHVRDALQKQQVMYYFGLGSNMLRSKLENRGVNGTKIEILHMEPAVVPNHRLSFNLRGFVPLEPGMGSLEPVDSVTSKALHAYRRPECHGALVTLTPENYEKVMRSEGVGNPESSSSSSTNNPPGYEEVVVTAVPYDRRKPAVQAIALRARPHVRLRQDPCPSQRYMTLLIQGAAELQLHPDYQAFLAAHPVQQSPVWLKRLAVYNLMFTFALRSSAALRYFKWPVGYYYSRCQSWLCFGVYVPSTAPRVQRAASHVAMAGLLAPGAFWGALYRWYRQAQGKELSPMIQRFLALVMEEDNGSDKTTNETTASTTTTATTKA